MKDYNFNFTVDGKVYPLIFNLNVIEEIQGEYGTISKWGELTDGKKGEVDAKALSFGLTAMYNEAIDIENEENGTQLPKMERKQMSRIISKYGLQKSAEAMNGAFVEATKSDGSKNA